MEWRKDWKPFTGWKRLKDRKDKEVLLCNLLAWLKEQDLTAQQVVDLLSIARDAVKEAYYEESLKIMF